MARIRSVHPGIWTDEAFVSASRDARLLFIGILNECDDQGAFEWKPLQIKMRLAAGDDATVATVSGWLDELERVNLLKRYDAKGRCYGAVRNFQEWQRPKKPNSVHPMPDEVRIYAGKKQQSGEDKENEWETATEQVADISPTGGEPVPNHYGTNGEKPPQMEEEGGRREEEEVKASKQPPARGFGGLEQYVVQCEGRPAVGDFFLDSTMEQVYEAARIDNARWTGNIGPLIQWMSEGIEPTTIVRAIRRCAERQGYEVPGTLKYFSKPVHEEHKRRPP